MKELEKKYRDNELSTDELLQLRDQVNAMSDDELGQLMRDAWLNADIDESGVDDTLLDKLKLDIDKKLQPANHRNFILKRVAQIAAAVFLPVLLFTSIYFYRQNKQLTSEEMVVSTGLDERANITLPDGTVVAMNENSRLRYSPKSYNTTTRQIRFSGEGYFQVHKDSERAFVIDARGLKVKVLGTEFNLFVRPDSLIAGLTLMEGHVLFTSVLNNESVNLLQGDKALLNQQTGKITVIREKNYTNEAAWKNKRLQYHETSFTELISDIEKHYKLRFVMSGTILVHSTDLFTGVLPLNNLNEALQILGKAYHFEWEQNGSTVLLKN